MFSILQMRCFQLFLAILPDSFIWTHSMIIMIALYVYVLCGGACSTAHTMLY